MTAGSDSNGSPAPVPDEPERPARGFAARRGADEPRFAGPPVAALRPAPALPPLPSPSSPPSPPPAPFDRPPAAVHPPPSDLEPLETLEPVVDYGPGASFAQAPRDGLLLSRIGSAVAVGGGVMAAIGSFFTWSTLRLLANPSDGGGFTTQPSSITYNGLSLLEGRAVLVLGVVAIALSAAAWPSRSPRLLAFALTGTGGLAVVVMAFSAIGHPVELATLFRSYRQIDAVKVSLPNGVGTWLAVIGALLILAGGLLALMRGSDMGQEGQR